MVDYYDASQETRNKDLDLEEARALIRKFSGEYPKDMREICEWLTINPNFFPEFKEFIEEPKFTEEYFAELCDI